RDRPGGPRDRGPLDRKRPQAIARRGRLPDPGPRLLRRHGGDTLAGRPTAQRRAVTASRCKLPRARARTALSPTSVRVDGEDLDREAARPKALAPGGAMETVTRGNPYNKRDPPAFPSTGPLSPHRALAFRL